MPLIAWPVVSTRPRGTSKRVRAIVETFRVVFCPLRALLRRSTAPFRAVVPLQKLSARARKAILGLGAAAAGDRADELCGSMVRLDGASRWCVSMVRPGRDRSQPGRGARWLEGSGPGG